MQKMTPSDGQSMNVVDENIAVLKKAFPEAFTEDGIDFEVLRQLLGDKVADGEEKYGLNWFGKKKARQIALSPSMGTLIPCPEESVNWDTTQNIFIEGDNLEVLKLLQKSYAGKVNVIYIDPPYNTGNDFVYEDDYKDNLKQYLKKSEQLGVTSNPETSGRYHTNWLNMLMPRLKVARSLLAENGVVFISIDDNEVFNLRHLCNEIFGEECFAGQITLLCNPKGRSQDKYLATCHEYILIYTKSILDKGMLNVEKSIEEIASDFPLEDKEGVYRELELRNTHREFGKFNRPNLHYPFYVSPSGEVSIEEKTDFTEVLPNWDDGFEGCWTWGKEKATEEQKNIVAKKVNSRWKIYRKAYASKEGEMPSKQLKSIWLDKRFYTEKGQKAFNELFSSKDKIFQSPKSVELLIELFSMTREKDDLVLDFFAGSGTTAHAVLTMNQKDGGKRRFICIQIPERVADGSYAQKIGYDKISEICFDRIKKVDQLLNSEGLKLFKLDSSNIVAWNPDKSDLENTLMAHSEHLVPGRSEQDVLYELLLKRGVELTAPIEEKEIAGKKVYSIGFGVLFACLDKKIQRDQIEELAHGIIDWHKELDPISDTQVVFRDSAFENDVTKANMTAILEQSGIKHVRSL